jgi:hypothetical protein
LINQILSGFEGFSVLVSRALIRSFNINEEYNKNNKETLMKMYGFKSSDEFDSHHDKQISPYDTLLLISIMNSLKAFKTWF